MSVIDGDWDFKLNFQDIEKELYQEFMLRINQTQETMLALLEEGFKVQRFIYNGSLNPNNDDELRELIEKNKQLRHDIEVKLEGLTMQQLKYEKFKKDQKLLSNEVKETHEAFLMAKKYYKKSLKLYFSVENKNQGSHTIFIQFFTESKKDTEKYSVRLLRDTKSGHYTLLSTTPKLNIFTELERRLKETNDVPGVLCNIRQAFLVIKGNKK